MEKISKRIIITVKVSVVDLLKLSQYSPYTKGCLSVYKTLLKTHSNVFKSQLLRDFLSSLKCKNTYKVFDNPNIINYKTVFGDKSELFDYWMKEDESHLSSFLAKIAESNDMHLIRKHKEQEIYLAPVLNENYNISNVAYVETLLQALSTDCQEVYLLLHDKDVYAEGRTSHNAQMTDEFGFDNWSAYPVLRKVVTERHLYVFQHTQTDRYYDQIVCNLGDLTLDGIINSLGDISREHSDNTELSRNIGQEVLESEMLKVLNKESEANIVYDFSKDFLDIDT